MFQGKYEISDKVIVFKNASGVLIRFAWLQWLHGVQYSSSRIRLTAKVSIKCDTFVNKHEDLARLARFNILVTAADDNVQNGYYVTKAKNSEM